MPSNEDTSRQARAARAEMIRDASGLSNVEFAARAHRVAKELGLETNYDPSKISKLVGALGNLSLDDALVLAALDVEHRGIEWLATGREWKMARKEPSVPHSPSLPRKGATRRAL